ncbi:MAG: DDE-type integrase/transposase/recombinase [Candidatus Obscuribacterales bacterium]|nr:DDE-type integrase/transposase/recombinase [Candidatus Obscuribacterales bacterium]
MTDNCTADEERALQKYALIAPCIEDGVTLAERASQTGVNRKTLARLIEKFDGGGLEALRRKERSDKGSSRVSEDTLKFVKGKLLTSPILSLATIERQVQRLNSHERGFSASYQQIRRIKNGIGEDLLVYSRSEKEFEEERELLFRHEAGHPNEVWQCDHKYLDIFVWNTSGPSARSVKPVLTAIIDDYSRAIMGYYLDLSPPSAQRTAITLRQAIWKKDSEDWLVCGIPERLYSDSVPRNRIGILCHM